MRRGWRDQPGVLLARRADDLLAELLLAAGEEVVDRPERCAGLRGDLLESGPGVAVAAEEVAAGAEDPGLRVVHFSALRPVLVLWAVEDKVMPRDHGRRLAELYPHAELQEVEDSYTLMPEDRPDVVAEALRLRRP